MRHFRDHGSEALMSATLKRISLLLAIGLVFGIGACSSDGGGGANGAPQRDTGGSDVDEQDAGETDTEETVDPDGEEDTEEEGQCSEPREDCDPSEDAGPGFECIDAGFGPKCMQVCEGNGNCPSDQVCLPSGEGEDAIAVCYPSQCQGPVDYARCSDVDSHPYLGDYGSEDARCSQIGQENCGSATLCVPGGTQETGDACTADSPIFCTSENCQPCNRENTCQDGTCQRICGADDDCNSGSCVGLEHDGVVGENAGFCGEPCDAFSSGQCSDPNDGCTPLNGEIGYCRSSGEKGYMEQCQPASPDDPSAHNCADGMDCIAMGQTSIRVIARCLPRCNPPTGAEADQRENNATCGGTYYGRLAHFTDDSSALDIYLDDELAVDDLQAGSIDSGAAEDDFFTQDVNELFGKDENRGKLKISVANGDSTDAGTPRTETVATLEGGRADTWVVHNDGSGDRLSRVPVPRGVPAPGEGNVTVRAAHLVPDVQDGAGNAASVDIVLTTEGGDPSNGTVLGEELFESAVTEFAEVAEGTYDVYLFRSSDEHQSGNAVATLAGVEILDPAVVTLVLHGTVNTDDSVDFTGDQVPYAAPPKSPRYRCEPLDSTAPGTGVCMNECRTDDYGSDWCSEDNGCIGFRGASVCGPTGDSAPGEDCSPGALLSGCEEGAVCTEDGGGNGTCRSRCVGGGTSNTLLQCGEQTECNAQEGQLGDCGFGCTPNEDQSDSSCPENLESCIPEATGSDSEERAFCSPSGSKAEGEQCGGEGDPLTFLSQNCEPGTVCANGAGEGGSTDLALVGPYVHQDGYEPGTCQAAVDEPEAPTPTCRQLCDPMEEDPCPEGQACGLDFLNESGAVGVCLDKVDEDDISPDKTPATGNNCKTENLGKMCGDRSHCLPLGQPVCYQFCDWETKSGCDGDTECQLPGDSPLLGRWGTCLPPDEG